MEPDEHTPSNPLPEWVLLEYFHMLQQVGIVGGKEDAKLFATPVPLSTSHHPTTVPQNALKADIRPSHIRSKVFFSHLSQITCESLIDQINRRAGDIDPSLSSIARRLPVAPPSTDPIQTKDLSDCICSPLSILDLLSKLEIGLDRVCLLDPKATEELKPEDGELFEMFLFGGILGDDPPRDRTAQLRICGFPSRHLGSIQMTTDTALAVTKRIVENSRTLQDLEWIDKPELVFNPKEKVEMPFRYLADSKSQPIMPDGMKELIRQDLNRSFEF